MRTDAYLLSSNGERVNCPRTSLPWRFSDLLSLCDALAGVYEKLDGVEHQAGGSRVISLRTDRGLRALSVRNPIATYEAASRRQTTKREDRIYGIQQIFNCRLGNTAIKATESSHKFSLEELEVQLGVELAQILPVSSQYHLFSEPTDLATQWRLQSYSFVPQESTTYSCYKDEVSPNMVQTSRFNVIDGMEGGMVCIELEGTAIAFEKLIRITRLLNSEVPQQTGLEALTDMILYLDAPWDTTVMSSHFGRGTTDENVQDLLISKFSDQDLRVVSLGVAFGLWSCRMYGILVIGAADDKWRRLGLCFWELKNLRSRKHVSSLEGFETLFLEKLGSNWEPFKGIYGAISPQ